MKCRVFYWKDPKYLLLGLTPGVGKPTPDIIETDYKVIWQGEVTDATTPEDIFLKFNALPVPFRLPPGIRHTSMSIGDVIQLGEQYYVCMPIGWERISTSQRGRQQAGKGKPA